MPRNAKRSRADGMVNTTFRLRSETLDWFREYAESQERTMSQELRRMIEQRRRENESEREASAA